MGSELDTTDLRDLLFGAPDTIAADLGVSAKTVQRWKAGKEPPAPIVKLLRMRYGDLAGLMGDEWRGFYFGRDGLFYHPDFKYGFAPGELRALFFNRQEVRWYRSEFAKMRAELSAAKEAIEKEWAARKVAQIMRSGAFISPV